MRERIVWKRKNRKCWQRTNAMLTPEKFVVEKKVERGPSVGEEEQHGTRGKDKITVIVGYGS